MGKIAKKAVCILSAELTKKRTSSDCLLAILPSGLTRNKVSYRLVSYKKNR